MIRWYFYVFAALILTVIFVIFTSEQRPFLIKQNKPEINQKTNKRNLSQNILKVKINNRKSKLKNILAISHYTQSNTG
ncbi:MAG TPA: hypothetical protein QF753_06145 [Victivallales bacterium]|nr:hypothetical protein [Victivallales bacterium]